MTTLQKAEYKGNVLPLIEMTIGNKFDDIVEQNPDHPAIAVLHQNIRWSYGEFQREVNRLAPQITRFT